MPMHTTAISDAGSAWRATFLYMKVGALVSLCAIGVKSKVRLDTRAKKLTRGHNLYM